MDEVPQREKVMIQLRRMKDSSPGDDQVTTGMMKSGGAVLEELLVRTIQTMWTTPPAEWEAVLHDVTEFRLFTKGSRESPKCSRSLWLIPVIVRLLSRIMSSRLQLH